MKPVSVLVEDITERRKNFEEIRERASRFCKTAYGIKNFFSLVDDVVPLEKDAVYFCLSRQIPTANIEHLALHFLPQWFLEAAGLKAKVLPLALTRDCFVGSNSYKRSLIKMPWLQRGRNGGLFVHCRNIQAFKGTKEGLILDSIPTLNGTLPEFHGRLREYVFGETEMTDVSRFHQNCLVECLVNKPSAAPTIVFQRVGTREARRWTHGVSANDDIRPPAAWFYLFYLMFFLDGSKVLLSTVDDNSEVDDWFTRSIGIIRRAVGVAPLIVSTPKDIKVAGYKSELLEFPHFIMEKGWQDAISVPPFDENLSVFEVKEHFEKQIINLV